MSPPSIRRSLLIRCGIGIGLLLALLSEGIYLMVRQSLFQELDDSIRDTAAILANQVELENEAINYEWQEGLGTNRGLTQDTPFQFWDEAHHATTRSPSLEHHDLPKFTGVHGAPLVRSIQLHNGHHARAVGLRVYPFVLPEEVEAMKERGNVIDPKTLPQTLVVARDGETIRRTLDHLRLALIGGTVLTLGIGFILIERAIGSSLRPIHKLASQVKDRAEHRLDEALDLPRELPSELTGLATHFNFLLERLAATRQRERDFIRHAAHELRTPIAGLRATTDLALSQPRDAAAYAAHLATCQKTADELGELVKRLSALARIGQSSGILSRESVNISRLLRECSEPFRERARELGLQMKDGLGSEPLVASADPALLRIIFNNLLDNAISYNKYDGEIRLSGRNTGQGIEISVENPSEEFSGDTERLFDPLFRRESSRHDATSHLGIGLTLSRDAAHAMGGTLYAEQTADGLRFTLSLPLTA